MANEVVINVMADTTKASDALGSMRQNLKKVGAAATIAGTAIVAFGVASLKNFAEVGDELHKMSIRTGFSTTALSEYRLAAELSGTSLAVLETGIRKMQRSIVDAGDEVAVSVDAFDKMGISFKDVKGKTPEKQFDILTKAMARMTVQEDKVAIAMDIFGKAGTELLPMLGDGEAGLEAMKQQARDLGLVFDEEAAAKAARLNDAMSTLKGAMSGVSLTIAENLAPIVSDLAIKIEKVIAKITAWTEAHPELARLITVAAAALGAMLVVVGPLLIALSAITFIAPAVATAFAIMTGPVGIITLAIGALLIAWTTNLGGIQEKTQTVFRFIKGLYESHLEWLLPGGSLIKALVFLKDNWTEIWDAISKTFKGTINGLIEMINYLIRALNTIQFSMPDWVPAWAGGGKSFGINIPEVPLIGVPPSTPSASGSGTPGAGTADPTGNSLAAGGGETDSVTFSNMTIAQAMSFGGGGSAPAGSAGTSVTLTVDAIALGELSDNALGDEYEDEDSMMEF